MARTLFLWKKLHGTGESHVQFNGKRDIGRSMLNPLNEQGTCKGRRGESHPAVSKQLISSSSICLSMSNQANSLRWRREENIGRNEDTTTIHQWFLLMRLVLLNDADWCSGRNIDVLEILHVEPSYEKKWLFCIQNWVPGGWKKNDRSRSPIRGTFEAVTWMKF